ncbi:MAG: sugar phosphate isomerase/epimerase [Pirellulales bacterium]|nr:sugar phosphate isomerase/epimerase [Pirellulales bacterium]
MSRAFGAKAPPSLGAPTAEKLGWRLGCQAWSFRNFTFFEAVDKTASLGLKYIEAFPGQKLSPDHKDLQIDENMSDATKKVIKKKLADSGVTLINFGVCGLSKDEAADRKVFGWAKQMGIETLVAEPPEEAMELLDKLCNKYQINVAIHNHPRPSHYWNPDAVLKAVKGRSKRIGACADTGHWVRSGLDPVQSLKILEGRIVSLHFKDLNKKRSLAHDVPWGKGVCDVRSMLGELRRQKFRGVFSIEYENHWDNSLPEIAQCVEFFEKVSSDFLKK